jgi:hypothetical protein
VLRGYEQPIPTFPLMSFAASRFPECEPEIMVDAQTRQLRLRYKHRVTVENQIRWQDQTDWVPFHELESNQARHSALLQDGDQVALARLPTDLLSAWSQRTYPIEQVLRESPRTVRQWFDGQAVVVGQEIAGLDEYSLPDGGRIFGCQMHARTLDALLLSVHQRRMEVLSLLLRYLAWGFSAAILMGMSRLFWRGRWASVAAGLGILTGVLVGSAAALFFTSEWLVELGIAVSALLTCGSLVYWIRLGCQRERCKGDQLLTFAPRSEELPSTLVAAAP